MSIVYLSLDSYHKTSKKLILEKYAKVKIGQIQIEISLKVE